MIHTIMEKEKLTKEQHIELIFDYLQRIMVHHAMWYSEVVQQLGVEKAMGIMEKAWQGSLSIQLKRLAKTLNFELDGNIPKGLSQLSEERVDELKKAMAVNWLANDGVWFQAVEFSESMVEAKACNDAAWSHFSPFEALRIKNILNLSQQPGLEGLKQALQFRLYADVNKQSIANETENSFDFYMNECRVQLARKRKGLDDYPCKSAGIIEYTTFAQTIDSRIKTDVIGCPPDKHPDEWFCGWHFYLEQ
jgi:hypothetical protein